MGERVAKWIALALRPKMGSLGIVQNAQCSAFSVICATSCVQCAVRSVQRAACNMLCLQCIAA